MNPLWDTDRPREDLLVLETQVTLLPQLSQVDHLCSTLPSLLKTSVDTLLVDSTKKVVLPQVPLSEEVKLTTSSVPTAARTKRQSTSQT